MEEERNKPWLDTVRYMRCIGYLIRRVESAKWKCRFS